jgi:GntR family transcriptional regulator, rspAB operon transcriptional repressor
MFPSVKLPETRVELVETLLRDAILSGKLVSGDRVNEAKIAKQFGVSRSPVREAIVALGKEGLLTVIPQKGTFVTKLSKQSAIETYHVRALLESYAVCTAIENDSYTPEDIQNIKILLDNIQQYEQKTDFYDAVKNDWAFHIAICTPCHYDLILEILTTLQGRILLCMFTPTLFYSKPGEQSNIHQRIFDAIVEKNADKAREVINIHHTESLNALLEKME